MNGKSITGCLKAITYHGTPPCPLIIYFYRCVRGINPTILQPYVQQTIHHLSEFDKQKQIAGDRSSNTCWPGFVAACKAIEPQTRQAFIRWLERSGEGTGIRMFNVALEAVRSYGTFEASLECRAFRGLGSWEDPVSYGCWC
ncbi:hypothetical protein BDQ94DRAFT_96056 [Aspergillus welwitschiae]|uniref:Uncharacterized protein n=1 Tax=Aspergillus welwitschiae TaxID=1341132 RepID=A0A3F3PP21_9EURO|nr:hypothetical protein BDQ94DRAFT_96056 [Aspergillus welwitschiae]RDH28675.1 hypothetical protein BDQ94DRAFT_96056 [Aspergillus welwitschiae]